MTDLEALEAAIRPYLEWLANPETLVDESHIAQLEERKRVEKDPIRRLTIAAELLRARTPSEDGIREAFIESSKVYAERAEIPVQAFVDVGVPIDDLRRSGFSPTSSSSPRSKSRRTTVEQVKAAVPQRPVTIGQLVELSSASPMTVRKALNEMIETGDVKQVDRQPGFKGPGRAPARYQRTALIES